ncbi:hypothetical protein KY366_06690 [Candidatus Woesearchaeota archaeon]|nr:hypothetical protein [Candidatus Woesearchaeota archaeon]
MRIIRGPIILLAFSIIIALSKANASEMSSPDYRIYSYEISSGGNATSSSNYKTDTTIGTISGKTSSSSYNISLGFFYTTPQTNATVVTEVITTTGGGGGGGGGGSSVSVIRETELISLNLINPGPLYVLTGEEANIPIYLYNDGDRTLNGITLSAETTATNTILSLSHDYIESLPLGGKATTVLNIRSKSLEEFGEFPIILKAKVSNPPLEAKTTTYLNILDRHTKNRTQIIKGLEFAKDLFKENPECLEFEEFLDQAEEALEKYEFQISMDILSKTIQACRDTISSKGEFLAPPAEEKTKNLWIFVIEMVIILFIVLLMFTYMKKRGRKIIR